MKICLIEDDLHLGPAIQAALEDAGFSVIWVRMAEGAESLLQTESFDAVLLDIGLPDDNGLNVLRRMRRHIGAIPTLIVTARDSLGERIDGLDAGADDYLIKPFANAELMARLRAVLRRSRPDLSTSRVAEELLTWRDLIVDPGRREAKRGGSLAALSPIEFALLCQLMRHMNRVLTRRQLEEHAMPDSYGQSLDVHMSNLRRKIGRDVIRTVRGVGYVIDEDNGRAQQ